MPLDKARITGFGDGPAEQTAPECPQGHELQLWAARSGKCDGCNAKVVAGEQVMDCRRCNWYLCEACCPQDKAEDKSSLWGALTSLPFYVLDDMSEMATDIESFVTASVFDSDAAASSKSNDKDDDVKVSPRQKAESVQIVTDFCENYPAARVTPNEMDLDVFWNKVKTLQPKALADAFYDQLSFSGDYEWQPRLRALHALEMLYNKGGMGREVAKIVLHSAKGLIQHLEQVSQCTKKAQQVMKTLKGEGEASTAASSSANSSAVATSESPAEDSKAAAYEEGGTSVAGTSSKPAAKAASAQVGLPKAAAKAAAKAAPAPDLLDLAVPEVVQPATKSGGLDLLDMPTAPPAAVGGPDLLLDLTATATPGIVASAPAISATPLLAPSSSAAASVASAKAAAPNLADLYALYPQGQTSSSGAPAAPTSAIPGAGGVANRGYAALGAMSSGGSLNGMSPALGTLGAMTNGGASGMRPNGMSSTIPGAPALGMGAPGSSGQSAPAMSAMGMGGPPSFASSAAAVSLSSEKKYAPEKASTDKQPEKSAQQNLESLLSDCVGNLEVTSSAGFQTGSMAAGRQIIKT